MEAKAIKLGSCDKHEHELGKRKSEDHRFNSKTKYATDCQHRATLNIEPKSHLQWYGIKQVIFFVRDQSS